jgi:hypothetical protein
VTVAPFPSSIDHDETNVAARAVAGLGMMAMIKKAVSITKERLRLFKFTHLCLVQEYFVAT